MNSTETQMLSWLESFGEHQRPSTEYTQGRADLARLAACELRRLVKEADELAVEDYRQRQISFLRLNARAFDHAFRPDERPDEPPVFEPEDFPVR